MNKFTSLLVVLVIGLTLASCNRCKECSYTYKIDGKDTTKTLIRECGKASELRAYESKAKAEAARNNANDEAVTCKNVK